MRTSRLSRWLIGGALAAAGAVVAFGGQMVGSGAALAVDTATDDGIIVTALTEEPNDDGAASTDTWEWN